MNFVRQHLFYIILGAVTLVLIGSLFFFSRNNQAAIEEAMDSRSQVTATISSLGRAPYHNEQTNQVQAEYNARFNEELQDVRSLAVTYNKKDYSVPELPKLSISGQPVETYPALPFRGDVWNQNQGYFYFVEEYFKRLDALQNILGATEVPSEQEINNEAVRQEAILQYRRMVEEKKAALETETADEFPSQPGSERRDGMSRPSMSSSRGSTRRGEPRGGSTPSRSDSQQQVSPEALDIATRNMTLEKANQGVIYASEESFNPIFIRGVTPPSIELSKIWDAQMSLWLQEDICHAIRLTIEETLQEDGKNLSNGSVMDSPIKRVVSIRMQHSQAAGNDASMGGGRGGRVMPRGREGADVGRSQATSLTGRTDNQMYNVVRYTLVLRMPARYVQRLIQNLARRNYHVVLNQQIFNPDKTFAGPDRSGGGGLSSGRAGSGEVVDESLYYYGVEPVCEVEIEGEMLMLADWVRGKWNEETREWVYPPLMPAEVMQAYLPSSALRPTDQQVINGRIPMPWEPNEQEDASASMPMP